MKRLAAIAAILLALVVTVSAVYEAVGEATSRGAPISTFSGTPQSGHEVVEGPGSLRLRDRFGAAETVERREVVASDGGVPTQIGSVLRGGTASWYCGKVCTKGYPAGSMVAAAGSELRYPGWRGSWVTVSHGGRSVRVQLVDFCRCDGNRIVDLYGAAFQKLADTSQGVIPVTVEYDGLEVAARPTLPATDTR